MAKKSSYPRQSNGSKKNKDQKRVERLLNLLESGEIYGNKYNQIKQLLMSMSVRSQSRNLRNIAKLFLFYLEGGFLKWPMPEKQSEPSS